MLTSPSSAASFVAAASVVLGCGRTRFDPAGKLAGDAARAIDVPRRLARGLELHGLAVAERRRGRVVRGGRVFVGRDTARPVLPDTSPGRCGASGIARRL